MFGRGNLLLVLLIVSSFYSQVRPNGGKLLDASSAVVDDQYEGCREEALKMFTSDLLRQEIEKTEKLDKAWKAWNHWKASNNCSSQIPGGKEEHTSALSIYHHADSEFTKELNKAVETMMGNVTTYENDFHFKAIHFLLMDSMRLLKPKACKQVYVPLKEGENIPKINSKVRLASFTVTEPDLKFIDLEEQTILKINTCFYVSLDDQLCQNLGKILLSPAEVFVVETVEQKLSVDGDGFTEVVLTRPALQSNHNCVMLSRSAADVPSHLFLPLLVAFTMFFMCL